MDESPNSILVLGLGLVLASYGGVTQADPPTKHPPHEAQEPGTLRELLDDGWHPREPAPPVIRLDPRFNPIEPSRVPVTDEQESSEWFPFPTSSENVEKPLLVVVAAPQEYPKLKSVQLVPNAELRSPSDALISRHAGQLVEAANPQPMVTAPRGRSLACDEPALDADPNGWHARDQASLREKAREYGFGLLSTDVISD